MNRRSLLHALAAAAFLACSTGPAPVVLDDVVVAAGCGTCIYKIPDGSGCYWTITHEGKHYPVAGALPHDHENHAPDGMCNMERQVRVSGTIRGENFVADRFELLPAGEVPSNPAHGPDDPHGPDYRAE